MQLLTIAMLMLLLSNPASQNATESGQLEGTVLDLTRAPLPGASLRACNVETGVEQHVQSDSNGFYRFSALPAGRYDLHASLSGFSPLRRTDVNIRAGATETIHLSLPINIREVIFHEVTPRKQWPRWLRPFGRNRQ